MLQALAVCVALEVSDLFQPINSSKVDQRDSSDSPHGHRALAENKAVAWRVLLEMSSAIYLNLPEHGDVLVQAFF